MPYIQVRSNKEITKEKEIEIKKRLGEAISVVGKSESWLMVEFVSQAHLYFKGEDTEDLAYVDVKLFGTREPSVYPLFTKEVCDILQNTLGIYPSNVYVSYGEYSNWGWNRSNF